MIFCSNVHTHTSWCDGANSSWEMAEAAVRLGFSDLGFSSHAQEIGHPGYGIDVAMEDAYKKEIREVQDAYKGKLSILCGIERDTYSPSAAFGFDYVIGSNHYLPPKGGSYVAVDSSPEELKTHAQNWYNGNWHGMVQDFYADSLRNVQENKPTIVGHFDLLKKYNDGSLVFDEESSFYKDTALAALDEVARAVKQYGGMVELNMGAFARGLCKDPYPAPFLLRHLAQTNTAVIVTGDSHSVEALDNGFDKATHFLVAAGFRHLTMLKEGAFREVKLEI